MRTQQQPEMTIGDWLEIVYFAFGVHAYALLPWLRYGQGREAYRQAWPSIFLLLLCCGVEPGGFPSHYLGLWLLMLAVRRAQNIKLLKAGAEIHSQFAGLPWLAMRAPFVRSVKSAYCVEPLLCLLIAGALLPLSPAIALLWAVGFVTLSIRHAVLLEIMRRRAEALTDAQIEQRFYSNESRGR